MTTKSVTTYRRSVTMKKLTLLFVAVAFSSPTLAADMAVKAPSPVITPANGWTGFYAGINGGYGRDNLNVNYSPNDPASVRLNAVPPFGANENFIPSSFATSGGLAGIQLGYNWQLSRIVLGVETDIDWSGIRGSSTVSSSAGFVAISNIASEKVEWFGTVRARLGSLLTDNLLLFVTGGFAYGEVGESGNYFGTGPAGAGIARAAGGFSWSCNAPSLCWSGSSSKVVPGWTVGTGFEYAVSKNVTLKAEYLFIGLNDKSFVETNLQAGPGTTPSTVSANLNSLGLNVVRAGLNYRF
jgi:outer membrane immunogenic protein